MEQYNKKSITDELSKYDYLINKDDPNNFIEITEWHNGEGYDILIGDKKSISLSSGEINAIYFLCKCLEYNDQF